MDGGVGYGAIEDWRDLGIRFRRLGYGISAVARALNVTHSTVQRTFQGSEPGYTNGLLLIRLYSRLEADSRAAQVVVEVVAGGAYESAAGKPIDERALNVRVRRAEPPSIGFQKKMSSDARAAHHKRSQQNHLKGLSAKTWWAKA